MRLQGKRAVISAAGSGIGRESALRFAAEGAAVCVADYDKRKADSVAEEIGEAGGVGYSVSADLTSADQNKASIAASAELMGGIDILWSHVGEPGPGGVEDLDITAYQRSITLNLESAVVASSAAIPHLRRSGGGAILYTSSVSGLVGSQFSPTYSAAKFGVVGLCKSLALALGPDNIRVNALCPGPVNTPMLPGFLARGRDISADELDELQRKLATTSIPLGRVAEARDVANAALFLASDEAAYITGVALAVDGGFSSR